MYNYNRGCQFKNKGKELGNKNEGGRALARWLGWLGHHPVNQKVAGLSQCSPRARACT